MKRGEAVTTSFEAEGFSLHLDVSRVSQKDRTRILQVMGEAAMTVKERLIV